MLPLQSLSFLLSKCIHGRWFCKCVWRRACTPSISSFHFPPLTIDIHTFDDPSSKDVRWALSVSPMPAAIWFVSSVNWMVPLSKEVRSFCLLCMYIYVCVIRLVIRYSHLVGASSSHTHTHTFAWTYRIIDRTIGGLWVVSRHHLPCVCGYRLGGVRM